MTTYAEARTACHLPPLEVQFNSIVAGLLFAEQRLDGSIVDAGAREGHNACFYAVIAPTRTVHAIEPIRANYRIINKLYSGRSNLRPLLAGLGSAHGAIDLVGGRPGAMLDKKKIASGALVAGNASDFVAHAHAHRKTVSRRRDLHFAGEVGARFLEAS